MDAPCQGKEPPKHVICFSTQILALQILAKLSASMATDPVFAVSVVEVRDERCDAEILTPMLNRRLTQAQKTALDLISMIFCYR